MKNKLMIIKKILSIFSPKNSNILGKKCSIQSGLMLSDDNLRRRTFFIKLFIINILIALLCTSCGSRDFECLTPETKLFSTTVYLNANGDHANSGVTGSEWKETGYAVNQDEKVNVQINGTLSFAKPTGNSLAPGQSRADAIFQGELIELRASDGTVTDVYLGQSMNIVRSSSNTDPSPYSFGKGEGIWNISPGDVISVAVGSPSDEKKGICSNMVKLSDGTFANGNSKLKWYIRGFDKDSDLGSFFGNYYTNVQTLSPSGLTEMDFSPGDLYCGQKLCNTFQLIVTYDYSDPNIKNTQEVPADNNECTKVYLNKYSGLIATNGAPNDALRRMNYSNTGKLEIISSKTLPATNAVGKLIDRENSIYESEQDGYIFVRVRDEISQQRKESNGTYKVVLSNPGENMLVFSSIVTSVKDAIYDVFIGNSENIFKLISNNTKSFSAFVSGMLVIYIIITTILFFMGMLQNPASEMVMRALKLGFVATLLTPQSWDFFYNYVFSAFLNILENFVAYINGFVSEGFDNNQLFYFADKNISYIMSPYFIAQVLSFFSLNIFIAILLIIAIVVSMFFYVKAIIQAVVGYCLTIIVLSILISISPIFIPMILFRATSNLFINWTRIMLRYSIEPFLLISNIVILNQIMFVLLNEMIGNRICWRCVFQFDLVSVLRNYFNISLPASNFVNWALPKFCVEWFTPWGLDNSNSFAVLSSMVILIFSILIIALLLSRITKFTSNFVNTITSTSPAFGFSVAGGGTVFEDLSAGKDALKEAGKEALGIDEKSKQRAENYNQRMTSGVRARVNTNIQDKINSNDEQLRNLESSGGDPEEMERLRQSTQTLEDLQKKYNNFTDLELLEHIRNKSSNNRRADDSYVDRS